MTEDLKALQSSIDDIAKTIKNLDSKTVAPETKVTFESLASSEDFLKGVTKGRTFSTHNTASDDQADSNTFEALIKQSGI